MLKLDSKIQRAEVVHTGPELVAICAQLRADCAAIGHALAQREHTCCCALRSLPRAAMISGNRSRTCSQVSRPSLTWTGRHGLR
jgi:hypothetical protein